MSQLSNDDTLIAVVGVTGSGKTTFVSKATGRSDLEIGHSIDSCTKEVVPVSFKLDRRNVTLLDTPGFDDTRLSDADILKIIAKYLTDTYQEEVMLTGIILLQPINQARLQGSEMKRTRIFKKLLGENAYKRVIIATTMWDQVSKDIGNVRQNERKSRTDVWGDMVSKGAMVIDHDNEQSSALDIIRKVMEFESTVDLQIQRELAENHGRLSLTSAGKQLDADLSEVIELLRTEITNLRRERDQNIQEMSELQKKLEAYEAQKSWLDICKVVVPAIVSIVQAVAKVTA